MSLDGYVDHTAFDACPCFSTTSSRRRATRRAAYTAAILYEVMSYWDEDHPEWDAAERDFAAAWRSHPKWVVSRTLKSVGPNATLVGDDLEAVIRGLKAELDGEIEVGGPDLARSLTDLGLIDEYRRIYRTQSCSSRAIACSAGPTGRCSAAWRSDQMEPRM